MSSEKIIYAFSMYLTMLRCSQSIKLLLLLLRDCIIDKLLSIFVPFFIDYYYVKSNIHMYNEEQREEFEFHHTPTISIKPD